MFGGELLKESIEGIDNEVYYRSAHSVTGK
jgi:hypothetical protein